MPKIGDIPWENLEHHYGKADDVPRLLGAVRSSDYEAARQAVGDLENAIYHQGGWICPAATAVLPFLVEIASDSAVTVGIRSHLLTIVGNLAEVPTQTWARVDDRWATVWQDCATHLARLLFDPDLGIRRTVAIALSYSSLDVHLRALVDRVSTEPDRSLRLDLRVAAGRAATFSADTDLVLECRSMLEEALADSDPMVQLAGLHGLAILDGDSIIGRHEIVLRAIRSPDLWLWKESDWGGTDADVLRAASRVFAAHPGERAELLLQLQDSPLNSACRQAVVMEAAEIAIPHRRYEQPLAPVIDTAIRDRSPDVRLFAVHLVAALGPSMKEYADVCANLARSSAQPSRAGVAGDEASAGVWALARFRDPRAVPNLLSRRGLSCFGFDDHGTHYPANRQMFWRPGAHEVIAQIRVVPVELVAAVGRRLRDARTAGERRTMCQIAERWAESAAPLESELVHLVTDSAVGNFAAKALIAVGSLSRHSRRGIERSMPPDPVLGAWLRAKYLDDSRAAEDALLREPATRRSMEVLRMIADLPMDLPDATLSALRNTADSGDEWLATLAANALCRRLGPTRDLLEPHVRILQRLAHYQYVPVMLAAMDQLSDLRFPIPEVTALVKASLASDWRITNATGWRACVEDEEFRQAANRYMITAET